MTAATLRRNGRYMVTVSVRHHLDLHLAALILADWWNATVPDLRGKGQRWALRQIRDALELHGEEHFEFTDERYPPNELESAYRAARQFLIDIHLYPYTP